MSLSAVVKRLGRFLENAQEATPAPSAEATNTVPAHLTGDELPEMITAGDRESIKRAAGRLAAMPTIPRPIAKDLAQPLADLAISGEPAVQPTDGTVTSPVSIKRAAFCSLEAICVEHPELVAPHARTIVEGITDYHVVVRDAAAGAMLALLRARPDTAGAVYELFIDPRGNWDEVTLRLLTDAAATHPVVLAPIYPVLQAYAQNGSLEKELIATAAQALAAWNATWANDLAGIVLEQISDTTTELTPAVIRLLAGCEPADETQAEAIAALLLGQLAHQRPSQPEMLVERVLELCDRYPVEGRLEQIADDVPPADRRRVIARIDETGRDAARERLIERIAAPEDLVYRS